jgi:hypothetical protein
VSAHQAARVRRAMDRGVVFIAATRSLDRRRLGCVGRIAFRFSTLRVPPLSNAWMRRLVRHICATESIPVRVVTPEWIKKVVQLARGRPGVALAIVNEASREWTRTARLPAPAAAYVDASIQRISGRPDRSLEQRSSAAHPGDRSLR